jgi:hypothetical protein
MRPPARSVRHPHSLTLAARPPKDRLPCHGVIITAGARRGVGVVGGGLEVVEQVLQLRARQLTRLARVEELGVEEKRREEGELFYFGGGAWGKGGVGEIGGLVSFRKSIYWYQYQDPPTPALFNQHDDPHPPSPRNLPGR